MERLEGGPVSSNNDVFPEVSGMAQCGTKGTEGGNEPWIRRRLTPEKFGDDRSTFVK